MERPHFFRHFFSVMGPAGGQALVVIANASEGPWESQLHPVPHDVPVPVDFWNVRPGPLGPMLDCGNLKLFRSDLIEALPRADRRARGRRHAGVASRDGLPRNAVRTSRRDRGVGGIAPLDRGEISGTPFR